MHIFRQAAILAAGMAFLAGCGKAVDTAAVDAELKADVRSWIDAYNAGDVDAIVAMYAPDAVVMAPGYPAAAGHDAIRAMVATDSAGAKAAGVKLVVSDGDTTGVSGDLAWHSGHYTVTDATGAEVDSGSYMEVQQNIDGKWLIVRDIWNSDRPKAPAPAPEAAPAAEAAPAV